MADNPSGSGPRRLVHETSFDRSEGDAAVAVVETIATLEATPACDLQRPLYDVVDPNALSRLFAPTTDEDDRRDGVVQFTYEGYLVIVDAAAQQIRFYQ